MTKDKIRGFDRSSIFSISAGLFFLGLGFLGYLLPEGRLLGQPFGQGPAFILTRNENLSYIVIGLVLLISRFLSLRVEKRLVFLVGFLGLYLAFHGFLLRDNRFPNFYGLANFEPPLDQILLLSIALLAFLSLKQSGQDRGDGGVRGGKRTRGKRRTHKRRLTGGKGRF